MIDYFIILIYFVVILGVGIYYRTNSKHFSSFARLNEQYKASKFVLIATIFASSIGGGTTFGITEKAYAGNLAYTYALLLTIPVDYLVARYIVPRISVYRGTETVGDIMAQDYGLTGRLIAGFGSIVVSIGLLAAQISVSGRILQYILDISYTKTVVLSYCIVIIYTTIGGFKSILFTNILQFCAMISAIPTITIIGLKKIGIENFIAHLHLDKIVLSDNSTLLNDTISAATAFLVMGLYPSTIQRILINKDHKTTSSALCIKTVLYFIFVIFITLNGLIAYNLYPNLDPHLALPHLIHNIAPTGIYGLIIVGLLASVMSTADSDLNVTSITLVKDFFSPIFNITNSEKLLSIARITNILIGAFAIIIAINFNNVIDLVIFIAGFWAPMIIVPLIFILFKMVISPKALLVASISGASAFLLWEFCRNNYYQSNIKGVFVGTIISLIVFLSAKNLQKQRHQ